MRIFSDRAFRAFEESVTCRRQTVGSRVTSASLRATVFEGDTLSASAGGGTYAENASDVTLVVRFGAWPFSTPPEFGERFVARGQSLTVKTVDRDEIGYSLRCTSDEREHDKQ